MNTFQRMSALYAPTLKEDPADADLASHRLLLRAGMIRKTAAGLYSYLSLAWRSLQKIEAIVRDEMDTHGAQELLMPILTPAELWEESGRWDVYGPELMRISDRHERAFALGPTHEETITDLVKGELRSYKQLPVNLYQIQDKFRDELRPRFGLMRGREFIMKDAYSFDADVEGMKRTYDQMYDAYSGVCDRCRIQAVPVDADSGQIGGSGSIEFMALSESGEASLVYCECGYAADEEAATALITVTDGPETHNHELELLDTPNVHTIDELAAFLDVPASSTRKAIALVDGEGDPVVCIIPGDHELNEIKAEHAFGSYHLMTDEELESFGLYKGCIGPVGLPEGIRCICDIALKESLNWVVGANKPESHYLGARPERDFTPDAWEDLASAQAGDGCPVCGKPLSAARGIEMGQIFQLGDKYSRALNATFLDKDGKEQYFQMGCYGIGVSRTLAAIVEQHHDDSGIAWPVSVAPFEVEVLALDINDDMVWPAAMGVCDQLVDAGIQTLLDDRKERPGVKFNDADLLGLPYQIIFGKRAVANGVCELKDRATGERTELPIADVAAHVASLVIPQRA